MGVTKNDGSGLNVENTTVLNSNKSIQTPDFVVGPRYFIGNISGNFNNFLGTGTTTSTGIYAANVTPPSADLGAYPLDGSGNKHN